MVVMGFLMSIACSLAAMGCILHGFMPAANAFRFAAICWLVGALAGMTDWDS